ncbi:hypothetical protein DAR30_24790, partial [Salmonella enterica subsp. enterica serovar Enteritidis]|nr:hypothetical protein [Salmonella enterica subsp. enterica serovar Enteritidis]
KKFNDGLTGKHANHGKVRPEYETARLATVARLSQASIKCAPRRAPLTVACDRNPPIMAHKET